MLHTSWVETSVALHHILTFPLSPATRPSPATQKPHNLEEEQPSARLPWRTKVPDRRGRARPRLAARAVRLVREGFRLIRLAVPLLGRGKRVKKGPGGSSLLLVKDLSRVVRGIRRAPPTGARARLFKHKLRGIYLGGVKVLKRSLLVRFIRQGWELRLHSPRMHLHRSSAASQTLEQGGLPPLF
jgi:hypothetical protein